MRKHTSNMITMLLLAVPLAVNAQVAGPRTDASFDVVRAVELENESQRWSTNFVDVKKAARLLEEAASQRPAADPLAIADLLNAGHLYYYARDYRRARSSMTAAAERATRAGDVVRAADGWINAAHLSVRLNDAESARDQIARARLLASSPHLSSVQVAYIRDRLAPPTVIAVRGH